MVVTVPSSLTGLKSGLSCVSEGEHSGIFHSSHVF